MILNQTAQTEKKIIKIDCGRLMQKCRNFYYAITVTPLSLSSYADKQGECESLSVSVDYSHTGQRASCTARSTGARRVTDVANGNVVVSPFMVDRSQ